MCVRVFYGMGWEGGGGGGADRRVCIKGGGGGGRGVFMIHDGITIT